MEAELPFGRPVAPVPVARPKQIAVLEASSQVFEMIMNGELLPAILNTIALAVDSSIQGTSCSIMLLDGRYLRHGAAPSLPGRVRRAFDGVEIGEYVGSCGTAAYIGETVIVTDIASDRRWDGYRSIVLEHGFQACWSIPIRNAQRQVLGTFALYYRKQQHPDGDDLAQMSRWVNLAEVAIGRARDLTALREAATVDPLTGLMNRTAVLAQLDQTLSDPHAEVAVLFIDLDQFKFVNDTFGHQTGDGFLKLVAQRLSAGVDRMDTVARIGGDEFLLVCPRVADWEAAGSLARRILADLQRPMTLDGRTLSPSVSIGVSVFAGPGRRRAVDLVGDADLAMYQAKRTGRNSVAFFTPEFRETAADRLRLEADLTMALQGNELGCDYQPVVDLLSQNVIGIEALLRWESPTRGPVAPHVFIPLAEDNGLILAVGERALWISCHQMARWRGLGRPWTDLTLWVNVSARQVEAVGFVEMVQSILRQTGLPATRLGLEVTESCFITDTRGAHVTLQRLRDFGVRIAIDDFGTGYSSLSQLGNLPVDILKIDQQFIVNISDESSTDSSSTVQAILMLAQAFKLDVVAEGVEKEVQRQHLIALGCHAAQGFLWSPAVPADVLESLMSEGLRSCAPSLNDGDVAVPVETE